MLQPKKKKFVNKKCSVTFYLGHRSQQDPLIADEKAPQRVLVEVSNKTKVDQNKQVEEQHKYGIYFDDDYNYLQHLKSSNEENEKFVNIRASCSEQKIQLPSSVFATGIQEDIGLLLKAAPRCGPHPDLDPDIVAALDDDFNYEDPDNILEDNFIELANKNKNEINPKENFSSEFETFDETNYVKEHCFMNKYDDNKSRFTEYSISSSTITRNQQLELLDKKFEQAFANYEDDNIGPLDCYEIEGFVPYDTSLLLQYSNKPQQGNYYKIPSHSIKRLSNIAELQNENSDSEDLISVEVNKNLKWDCESILSTNSNIYNRPKIIMEPSKKIKINLHTGMPVNVFGKNKLTQNNLIQLNKQNNDLGNDCNTVSSVMSTLSQLSVRPKGEGTEDRKQRKQLLKDYRKERRKEKKNNRVAFKVECQRQSKVAVATANHFAGNTILH
ncbi:protein LTV1 homolog isoform X2 [Agrilus planipennis]|uniref:Protein LTV1 homolog n=1 Tax=Agrilus planipennis TaxID=224129 RepID=A0A7F5RAH1_AGRPL|nr:protein LTV1 homolog isoform X2 [Agrilus planipennis]